MKRDLDLIRAVLLRVEEQPPGQPWKNGTINGYDVATAVEHIYLLNQAGYIQASVDRDEAGVPTRWVVYRMTMEGHDFLDSIRSPEVYTKTKEHLRKVGGTAALEVVKALAQRIGLSLLGIG